MTEIDPIQALNNFYSKRKWADSKYWSSLCNSDNAKILRKELEKNPIKFRDRIFEALRDKNKSLQNFAQILLKPFIKPMDKELYVELKSLWDKNRKKNSCLCLGLVFDLFRFDQSIRNKDNDTLINYVFENGETFFDMIHEWIGCEKSDEEKLKSIKNKINNSVDKYNPYLLFLWTFSLLCLYDKNGKEILKTIDGY